MCIQYKDLCPYSPAPSPTCNSPPCSRCCRPCWSRWAPTPGWVYTHSTWDNACATVCPQPAGSSGQRSSYRSRRTEPCARSYTAWTAGQGIEQENKIKHIHTATTWVLEIHTQYWNIQNTSVKHLQIIVTDLFPKYFSYNKTYDPKYTRITELLRINKTCRIIKKYILVVILLSNNNNYYYYYTFHWGLQNRQIHSVW